MTAQPKLLSECGERYVIDDNLKDTYSVVIKAKDYLVVEVGAKVGTALARFQHPNIAATQNRVYEFKHYRACGSKFWTSCAGVSHYFVIPADKITLYPIKGLSYVHAAINGVKVSFNVSGGGGGGNWQDWLGQYTQISVGHSLKDIKRIAEVAVRGTSLEPIKASEENEEDRRVTEERWTRLVAEKTVRPAILKRIKAGTPTKIRLAPGTDYMGDSCGDAVELYTFRKALTAQLAGYRVKVKFDQIDWLETGRINGIDGWGREVSGETAEGAVAGA